MTKMVKYQNLSYANQLLCIGQENIHTKMNLWTYLKKTTALLRTPMKKLTFLFTEKESNNEIFLAEVLKLAVTHTACTKTVVGEAWFNDYINDLSKSDQEKLQISKSST